MAKIFHFYLGLVFLVLYIFFLLDLENLLPNFMRAKNLSFQVQRVGTGVIFILTMPLISIACFMKPDVLTNILSPSYGALNEALLKNGFWYIVGYITLAVSVGLFLLFI